MALQYHTAEKFTTPPLTKGIKNKYSNILTGLLKWAAQRFKKDSYF
jgi:hypothetical protein